MNSCLANYDSYRKNVVAGIVLVLTILFSGSCNNTRSENRLIFNNNSIISYAERLKIDIKEGYLQISIIDPWQGANGIQHMWYLVPRGSNPPEGIDPLKIIYVPVRNIICMSATYLSMITALHESGTITGISGGAFLYDQNLIERFNNGLIRDIGYEDNLNKERIISINPDLIMVYGIGSESAGYIGKIQEIGVKVLYNADYLETDPLGRAEWIKLFGSLFCKEDLADEIFRAIEKEYNTLKTYISVKSVSRPYVLLGLPYRDTWYISPGNSYISRMIEDAGGNYLWKEKESFVSMPFGIENVYLKALEADYWLNIGTINSKKQISAIDPRLEDFQCFKKGNLYNNNKRSNSAGGNDYWESGNINPHVILKDIASILHPELFAGHDLYYYRKIN